MNHAAQRSAGADAPTIWLTLTNRGTVKRRVRELEAGEPSCRIERRKTDDERSSWSDEHCLPLSRRRRAARRGLLQRRQRHQPALVRSVLAYQQHCRSGEAPEASEASGQSAAAAALQPSVIAPWDPGQIADEALVSAFRQAAVAKARQRFTQGVLVELTRGAKPVARFLDSPCTLRFLVPGDLRYVSADCDSSLLATFVPLAVWAFRRLPPEQTSGLVAFQQAVLDVPRDLLAELDALLAELGVSGIAGCAATWPQRLLRLEASLRKAGLVWPAELLVDLHEQCTPTRDTMLVSIPWKRRA